MLGGFAFDNLKKFDLAIKDFTMSIKKDPYSSDTYNNRGFSYYNKKEYNYCYERCRKYPKCDTNKLNSGPCVCAKSIGATNYDCAYDVSREFNTRNWVRGR